MSRTAIELAEGTSISVGDGTAEATRTFFFDGYEKDIDVIRFGFGSTPNTIGSGGGPSSGTTSIPKLRDRHPTLPSLFAYKYDLNKANNGINQWHATFSYRKYTPIDRTSPDGLTIGPETVDFVDVSARCTGSFHDVYRGNVFVAGGNSSGGDIGGEYVDCGGVPTSVMRQQYEITVNVTKNADQLMGFHESVGKRCSASVLGLDGPATLYKGAAIQRIGTNVFSVSHTFLYDSEYHLVQVPEYLPDGQPNLETSANAHPTRRGKFKVVRHVQPFDLGSPDPAIYVPTNTGIG